MRLIRRLHSHRSGTAAIEFAMSAPILLMLGLYGAEIAWMATVNMKVSQIALSAADNASRLGQADNSGVTPTIVGSDVDAVLFGALEQGKGIGFSARGRVILSSLERDAVTGLQYIHWQRCRGSLARSSSYGNDTTLNGLIGPVITGLGNGSTQVTAQAGSAVMFAEVWYRHTGLMGDLYIGDTMMKREAAFIIRDDRNLVPGITGVSVSNC